MTEPTLTLVVPVELTSEMWSAGESSIQALLNGEAWIGPSVIWRQMLAAAPPPPAPPADAARIAELEMKLRNWEITAPMIEQEAARDAHTIVALRAENTRLREALDEARKQIAAVQDWARQKCPCKDEQPDPCPLCGARVDDLGPGGVCKAGTALPYSLNDRVQFAIDGARSLASAPAQPEADLRRQQQASFVRGEAAIGSDADEAEYRRRMREGEAQPEEGRS